MAGVYWSSCMLEMVRRPPLATTVFINAKEYNEGEDVEARVGERLQVRLSVENCLLEPVEDCRLLVKLDQDSSG